MSLLLPAPESLDIGQVTAALAEMLEQFGIGQQREAHRIRFPRPRIRFREVYRDVDFQVTEVNPVKTFGHLQRVGVGTLAAATPLLLPHL